MRTRRSPSLGADLRSARKRRGLAVRELAALAGVSPEAVSAVERGYRYPSLPTLEALAGVLQVWILIGPDETIVNSESPH